MMNLQFLEEEFYSWGTQKFLQASVACWTNNSQNTMISNMLVVKSLILFTEVRFDLPAYCHYT